MSKVLGRILSALELAAAVLFLMVLAAGAALHVSGKLTSATAKDVWLVLSKRKRAVSEEDYLKWQAMEKEAGGRTAVQREEETGSGRADEGLQLQRNYWERQFEREKAILEAISQVMTERRAEMEETRKSVLADRKKLDDEKRLESERRNDESLRKALQLYQGMDSELVAADFERRWGGGGVDEQDEIVELLRRMPPRLSAEIVGGMTDSTIRVAIMKEIRNAKTASGGKKG